MPHTCTYFCTPPLHAHRLLAAPWMTSERILESYARQGKHVERIVPAREADIPAWQKDCTQAWNETSRDRHHLAMAPPYATVPWIVFLRHEKKANAKTEERQDD